MLIVLRPHVVLLAACLIAVTSAVALKSGVAEAVRSFPPNAQRGELKAHQYPYYTIGKRTYRMGAGGRIYNEQNLIAMPASVQRQTGHVMYATDIGGNLHRLWFLTAEEAARIELPKQPKSDDKDTPKDGKPLTGD
jgi:hypothetical protein